MFIFKGSLTHVVTSHIQLFYTKASQSTLRTVAPTSNNITLYLKQK